MKLTSQQIERIALWAVVLILIVVVVFSQRRSGFTPTAGAPISLMDLQEYSYFTEQQKTAYRLELTNRSSTFRSIIDNRTTTPDTKYMTYSAGLISVMKTVLTPNVTSNVVTSNVVTSNIVVSTVPMISGNVAARTPLPGQPCPPGQSQVNGICYICPSGFNYNSAIKQCYPML